MFFFKLTDCIWAVCLRKLTVYVLMGGEKMQSCVSMQIFIHGLVPVKLCNLFTKNKIFEIVKMESLAGAGG